MTKRRDDFRFGPKANAKLDTIAGRFVKGAKRADDMLGLVVRQRMRDAGIPLRGDYPNRAAWQRAYAKWKRERKKG